MIINKKGELVTLSIVVAIILLIGLFIAEENSSKKEADDFQSEEMKISILEETPYLNYSALNYTTLKISEADFRNLSYYRQTDWLNGVCYPRDCGRINPPVCKATYAVYCYNPDSEGAKYFKYQILSGEEK